MTSPRIISAAVAEELRRVSDAAIESMTSAGAGERETRAAVLVRDLAASVVALHARAEQAEANYRWMVERAADQRLDGYRELGARCAALEAERDAAADAERARIAARIKELADKAYAAGNEPRGDALLNAYRIVQTSRVTP